MSAPGRLIVAAAAAASIVLTVSLGNWQLRRADEKLALQSIWDRAEQAAAAPINGADVADVGRRLPLRVVVRGRFLPAHEVWLDNRQMDSRAGLMLIAPLRLDDGAVVLVNRGFAARDPNDRGRLPEVARPAGDVAVEGLALEQTSRVLPLGVEAPVGAARPLVWQNLDYDAFERATGLSVARWVIQQTGGPDDGLSRNWPRLAAGVDKHRGYAAQWFGLAALIAVLTIVLGIRALRRVTPTPVSDE